MVFPNEGRPFTDQSWEKPVACKVPVHYEMSVRRNHLSYQTITLKILSSFTAGHGWQHHFDILQVRILNYTARCDVSLQQ